MHTSDYNGVNTQILHDNVSITSSVDILHDIVSGKGPQKQILALGYAGWAPGQLEKEMKANSWITIPADEKLVFYSNNEDKWQQAANFLGINFTNYSTFVGNS